MERLTQTYTIGKRSCKLRWVKNKALDRAAVSGDNTRQTKIAWVLVCACGNTLAAHTDDDFSIPEGSGFLPLPVHGRLFMPPSWGRVCTHRRTHRGGDRPILTPLIYIFRLSCGRILGINATLHFLTFNELRQ